MAGITRKGDTCTGHGCFPSRPGIQGSRNVFVNGKPAHGKGDAWSLHGCALCPSHGGILAQGSTTVYVNARPVGRIGDAIDCGSRVKEGSQNVFAGG